MAKKHHAHGCFQCSTRYTDHCADPKANGLCQACRGMDRPRWEVSFDPGGCCAGESRLVKDAQTITSYGLAGPGPWYKCRVCARTHPFNPKEKA